MTLAVKEEIRKGLRKPMPMSTNTAIATAARDLDVDVVSAYPITPQTTVVEKIAEYIADGQLDAEMIHVESEHSALSAAIGAAVTGARSFTATASQGLALMHEILHIASGGRVPVVMSVATRALSAPISIWNDHSDVMNARDSGWIIAFVSSAQEAYDTVIQAFRVAEDPDVLLPFMVVYDGYLMSHTMEPVITEDREKVLAYAPKRDYPHKLDPKNPLTIGTITDPNWYYEFKYQQVEAMKIALEKFREADREFGKVFGRNYGVLECVHCEDADAIVVANTSYATTLKYIIRDVREQGMKVGLLKMKLYRPFPVEEFLKATSSVDTVLVVDRAISYGAPVQGPLASEINALYHSRGLDTKVVSVVAGIGQRAFKDDDAKYMFKLALESRKAVPEETIFYGVRK
ncbi:MAG: ferredoxin oxidoreductase [Desulfurococcales archaeon]|nr:ferredoxin oxidoreductase [Desulfurococcales archaeon]